jgi:carotenoid cleavage dioxygenase-like enzyme
LKDKTVKHEQLLETKWGTFDLPTYNHKWDGVAKQRFTYLFHLMHQPDYDENYHWPIHKYDDDQKKIVATWGPPMTIAQEPRFIANPDGTTEEDGIIMSTVYDFKNKKSSIFVIDPVSMTTLQEYELPFRLSI